MTSQIGVGIVTCSTFGQSLKSSNINYPDPDYIWAPKQGSVERSLIF